MQACQKELGAQKAAYERAMAKLMARQQAPVQPAQPLQAAAAALRSHPLTETPPRAPPAEQSAGPPVDAQAPKMPALRSRYFPGSMRSQTSTVTTTLHHVQTRTLRLPARHGLASFDA